jgi:flagellar hook protein FlgE
MALIGSLNSGISALRNFARGLEVIGNNIANVNSTAYKGSRTKYTDSFSQFLKQAATAPTDGEGSNAPAAQIGLGVQISGIQTSFLQGGLTTTGQTTDLAISGAGFFQVRNSQNNQYFATRAGDFRTDDRGYITTNDGYRLQGLTGGFASYEAAVDPDGRLVFRDAFTTATSSGDMRIDFNPSYENGRLSNTPYLVDREGNLLLDASNNPISALGAFSSLALTVNASGNLEYNGTQLLDTDGNPVAGAAGNYLCLAGTPPVIALNPDGNPVQAEAGGSYIVNADGDIMIGADNSPIVAYTDADVLEAVPKMQSYSFMTNGDLNVFLTNGDSFVAGRVLLMDFHDPTALVREGANLFSGFDAAGVIGSVSLSSADNTPGSYGLGSIQGGTLELSNVDLAEEFANMITTQRSFQAGSRIITVSDDVLNELVNLKR